MHIPGFDTEKSISGREAAPGHDIRQPNTRLNQSSGQEEILSQGMAAITITNRSGFSFNIECLPRRGSRKQIVSALPGTQHRIAARKGTLVRFELGEEISSSLNSIRRQTLGRIKRPYAETRCRRIIVVRHADE